MVSVPFNLKLHISNSSILFAYIHSSILFYLPFDPFIQFLDLNDEDVIKALQSARRVGKEESEDKIDTKHDMETCFGFDVSSI